MTDFNDEEAIENSLADAKLVKDVLGLEMEAFERFKADVMNGWYLMGNQFMFSLGQALYYAPIRDAVRILHSWRRESQEAAMSYRIYLAKQTAMKKGQSEN